MPLKIDYRKCNGCRRCYDICPMDVYVIDEESKMPRIEYPDECWLDGMCFYECPKRAIEMSLPVGLW